MARLSSRPSAQRQEIPDSYETQQQELSFSSSDFEGEHEDYHSRLIQQHHTPQQPEDDDDDDDDGAVNLFLLDIVNQAATPSKKAKDIQADRLSSLSKSPPIASRTSPRTRPGTQGTQNTQSSTQSDEGHFAHYMRRQRLSAQQKQKRKDNILRRPSARANPQSRSVSPVELFSEGKPDPYEFLASSEGEINSAPEPEAADFDENDRAKGGAKRKRKETATAQLERDKATEEEDSQPAMSKRPRRGRAKNDASAQRAQTPEEPVAARRSRRGQDKPDYSPDLLRKEKPARRKKPQEKALEEVVEPPVRRWAVPTLAKKLLAAEAGQVAESEQEHEPQADVDKSAQAIEFEKTTPVVEIHLKRTRSRKAALKAEPVAASSAAQNRSRGDVTAEQDSDSIIGNSSTRKIKRKCASCNTKSSNHWHSHLWNNLANDKHYCNNCYSKDYKRKKKAENFEKHAGKQPPNTALGIFSSPPSTWAGSGKEPAAVTQVPTTQSESQASQSLQLPESAYTVMMRKKQQEALAKVQAEAELVSSPIPETPKRSRSTKRSSAAPQCASPKVLRKPRQHFKDTTSPVAPSSASKLSEIPEVEPSSPNVQMQGRPKSASLEVDMKPARTTRQSKQEKARLGKRASVEPPMNVRETRSRKAELEKELSQIEERMEQQEPETADFNMENVPESLFVSQDEEVMEVDMEIQVEGDRDMLHVGEGQDEGRSVINYDDSPWEEDAEEEAESEAEDKEEKEDVLEEGVSGITSILMAPSPRKVPLQKIALPQRQLKPQEQKQAVDQPQKTEALRRAPPSPSPPFAPMESNREQASLDSQEEKSPVQEIGGHNSVITMDYRRNPFEEPTFKFTSPRFSATSRCFIKDMLLDSDVREMAKVAKDICGIMAGVDRQTQQAKEFQKLQQFLVADYKAMRAQHNSYQPDEGVVCDLYGNIYTNTRKLHRKIYAIIDNDLSDDREDISNGDAARRNKLRKKLLRDVYLFIVPDMLEIIRAMMVTYCFERTPGMLCFEEIQGVVRITRNLLRAAENETNKPHRPRQLPEAGNDYHYSEYRKLIRTFENINRSCDTVLMEQAKYEKEMEEEEQRKTEARNENLRKQQKKELLQREQEEKRKAEAEEAAEEKRIRAEKLRAWQERNAPILNQWKGKSLPRQFARSVPPVSTPNPMYQRPLAGSQETLPGRMKEVGLEIEDPFAHDVRAIQPIVNGRSQAQQAKVDNRPVELRRKPVVAASGRKMPWAQNAQILQAVVRPHALPMSNNDSDDDAFDVPQLPKQRRKFVHHLPTADGQVGLTSNHDEASLMSQDEPLVPMDLDSEEEELPEHPVSRRVPRARIEEEERSLTQRRLDEEQRLKLLWAEAEHIEKESLKKLAAIADVERRKAELEFQEREYYATRDEANENVDLALDDMEDENENDNKQEEPEYEDDDLKGVKIEHAADSEEDEDEESQDAVDRVYKEENQEEDIYGDSGSEDDQPDEGNPFFLGDNNNINNPVKPWTHEDILELIAHLKFYEYKNKYIEAANSLGRSLDDVIETANEHKEDWAEEYLRQGADVPMWVKDIGRL